MDPAPQTQQPPSSYVPPASRSQITPRPSFPKGIFLKIGVGLRKAVTHPITVIKYIILLLLLLFLIYAIYKILPVYDKLHDLKDKLATLDAFKDKVTAKLGGWLDDGKELAENMKDKTKETADKVIDAANKVLGKVKVSIPHVELDRRDGVVATASATTTGSALIVTLPFPASAASPWSTDTPSVDATPVLFALEERKGFKPTSKPKPGPAYHCGVGQNCTSAALTHRAYTPLPLFFLINLARLARGVSIVKVSRTDAQRCGTSTLTVTATIWTPGTPALEVRGASFPRAMEGRGGGIFECRNGVGYGNCNDTRTGFLFSA
ncbi:hypothetical protein P171DRAFT_433438 [Karstenula rhodostoma CBS 690.94]|uniref:Uncharacterized protein n=1 Tax=Karstenula rhodostoma CBS 690.94 TaxID=1392251 RepID=A0A9P4PHJ5_9PLEO|nr:hypothetical protein P171DRAFT_433438 [Karstenula rhodostoma CBS 690.94]